MSIEPAVLLLALFPIAMYVFYVALLKETL